MYTEILGVILIFVLTLGLSYPLGKYIAKVYAGQSSLLDFMAPWERFIYRFCGIHPEQEMGWKEHLVALLTINMVWFLWVMVVLTNQGWLPLNPDGNPSMSADLAFNTSISFLINCNLQHYSGESGVTYFSQLFALTFLMFVSAATGMAACAVLFTAMKERTSTGLGNFYVYLVTTITRILLPIAFVAAIILVIQGVPMTFEGKASWMTLEGVEQFISRGPAAVMIAIKHLGTNGGGFYGANSAHPLENPNYFTNVFELVLQTIIPMGMVFALGFYLKRKKLAWMIFGVMTIGFLLLLIPTIYAESQGNPALAAKGIDQTLGAMEGKEIRFGVLSSAYWSIITTIISTGSVNAMHDSFMPMSGLCQLLGMMINCFYGGCGVGILNFYIFIIIAVFVSGLMVGRTPEFLGKKIEAKEMKIAVIIALIHPLLILGATAIASAIFTHHPGIGWLNNPGFHGFSEMLYEYTSSAANNGSGYEGLGDNTPWWNISCGIVLILSRYLPIIGPIAIAGILAGKKYIPESAGTLKTDTSTFGFMVLAVIVIIAALAFFPALALGPLAEYFSIQ